MMPTPLDGLQVVNATKTFGKTRALDNASLHAELGEITALLGPSGSGKSTLLYAVAGLESLDSGDILWDGRSLRNVPTHRRNFGLMFQDFALFPHMNVAQNVAFGLRMTGVRQKAEQRVAEMLELVGLGGLGKRDVNTLSGGEQQRVALARALAPQPRLLMLDEPLGSLDRNLRERLVVDLREILKAVNQTAVYVTHDQEEAFVLANKIAVMQSGRVEQVAAPQALYRQPANLFVARFLGLNNLFPGQVRNEAGKKIIATPFGSFPAEDSDPPGPVTVLVRPDEMQIGPGKGVAEIEGAVVDSAFRGSTCRIVVDVNGARLTLDFLSGVAVPAQGERLRLSFDPLKALQVLAD